MVNESDEAHPHAQQPPANKADSLVNPPDSSPPPNTGKGSLPDNAPRQPAAPQPVQEETEPVETRHEFDHYHGSYHGAPEAGHEDQAHDPHSDDHPSQAGEPQDAAPVDDESERLRRRRRDRERAKAGWNAGGSEDQVDHDGGEPEEAEVVEAEEEGGGPVKSFLEHLEDLRWVLIKSMVALIVGMVVCLVAANKVVELLKIPLEEAQKQYGKPETQVAVFQFGTNTWQVPMPASLTNLTNLIQVGTSPGVKFVLEPVQVDDKVLIGVTLQALKPEEVISQNHIQLINLGPVSPFAVAAKIALYGGIGLALPAILFFVGAFVLPALKKVEKKFLIRALAIGTVLFAGGVVFCYFCMLSLALNAAVQFSKWMSFGADQWRAEEYFGFVVKFLLGMGLSFELPVVLLTLVKVGLLDYGRLTTYRSYFIVVNLVVSAILTPPDPVSMTLMALPLQLLYELSVLIAWFWHRKEKRLEAEAEAAQ